jgi:hypothetical protein
MKMKERRNAASMFLPPVHRLCFARVFCAAVVAVLLCRSGRNTLAAPILPYSPAAPAYKGERTIDALFSEEIQQAPAKLKWRGEALAPDTLYAIALTGLSWQPAWGREHLFYMGWGDLRKVPGYKQHSANYAVLTRDIQGSVERRDWRRVVAQASTNFSLDEIACDPNLKEAVGRGFLELRQPERAFPIFAAPFEPSRIRLDGLEANRRCREGAFEAAQQAGLQKEAVAFALSLLLEPGTPESGVNTPVLRYLEGAGVDMDRVLLGILQAPERLHGLPSYTYAAADLLTMRATPRLLPFFLHLAGTDDAYLHGRALVGMGVLAYRARRGDPSGWSDRIVMTPLREYGISTGQRKMIADEILKAARSDNYRLRASACLALALLGDDDNVPLLQKLASDKAYVLASNSGACVPVPATKNVERDHARRLLFPVRMAAAAALARYGVAVEAGGGELMGKELDQAKRGGQDVTNDRRSLRREIASQIVVSPIDVATAAPIDALRR